MKDAICKHSWEMAKKSFQAFIAELQTVEPKSLTLTKETLEERRSLEHKINNIQSNITSLVYYLHELNIEDEVLNRYKADINKNVDITYEVYDYYLEAKSWGEEHGFVKRTTRWLKQKYGENLTAKQMIEKCIDKLEKCQDETLTKIHEASQCVIRLREIALRPTPMSAADYIEACIIREKTEKRKGWEKRKWHLEELKKKAEIHKLLALPHSKTSKFFTMYHREKGMKVFTLAMLCQSKLLIHQYHEKASKRKATYTFCNNCVLSVLH